jgi:nicotinate phosphoribosyltransferase
MGGFDATSNVLAGQLLGIPVRGTHAHSLVSVFSSLNDLKTRSLVGPDGREHDFVEMVQAIRKKLKYTNTNEGELAAFIAYSQAFPQRFLGLVDTYDTLKSGVPNFLCVAIALMEAGYKPLGIRLDSGDLAYLSKEARKKFEDVGKMCGVDVAHLRIVASNEINETTLISLNQQGHEVDAFGIGTHLVTCQRQPALGGVYKLVEINGKQRIKLSQEKSKMTIPGRKEAYRLIGQNGYPLLDLMILVGEDPPRPGKRILCRHPFEAVKRAYTTPAQVIPLHTCVWEGRRKVPMPSIEQIRQYVLEQLSFWRPDHLRPLNPTPYKVSVSDSLYNFLHNLWLEESPIDTLE